MKNKNESALEALCKVSNIETAKKVFGKQYDKILDNLNYIFENGCKDLLSNYYELNKLEIRSIPEKRVKLIFTKGLKKVGYTDFDIDFNDSEQVKIGIYGYNIATIYKMLYKNNKSHRSRKY